MSDFLEEWASESEKNKKICAREDLILDVTEDILIIMEEKGVSKAELSRQLGKSRSFVSQTLNGARNMTLRTLSDISFVLDIKPNIQLIGESGYILNGNHRTYNWELEKLDKIVVNNVHDLNKFKDKVTHNLFDEQPEEYEYA